MFEEFLDIERIDIYDPYNMLPVEKTIVFLGERR